MPDPKNYESQSDFMSACVPTKKDEGMKQEQAVAACLGMWKNKEVDEAVSFFQRFKELFTKEKPMKTVGGEKYPSSDFLVVEDSQKPSSWHLQVKKHGKPDHNLMGAAKAALTKTHRGKPYGGPNKSEALAKLKRMYKSEGLEWTKEIQHPFIVWKEQNQWRWLAIYSNKFRDEDNPPEILAETAHQGFVEAVDKGEWPMPELWIWHVRGTKSGAADYVAYDNSGFALASGTFDADKAHVAEALSEKDNLLTSHGMPVTEIGRDTEDTSIITRYRSVEISPLPQWAAANKHSTGFTILSKEVDMALPENKRPFLEDVMGKEQVADLERQLEDKAKELEEQGIEFKEETQEEEPATEEEIAPEESKEAEETPVEEPEQPQYVTYEELEEVFGGYVKPLTEGFVQLQELVQSLGKEVKEQAEVIQALQEDDESKMKQVLAETPASSLFARIGSVIGSEEALEDGRTSLAKSKPTEVSASSDGPTYVPILNELIANSRGG